MMMMMMKIWYFESFRVKKSCFCLEVTERRPSFVGNFSEERTLQPSAPSEQETEKESAGSGPQG
jgi:hypothetical protein